MDPKSCCLCICLLVFICLFVCFCLYCPVAQKVHHWWDPAFCCVWCLGSKRFLLSLFVWSLVLLILYVDTLWWCVREVTLPLHPSLMWHPRCLSTLLSTLSLLSTSVFYFCYLIYPSSISTDMGNKGVFGTHLFAWLLWFCLYPSSGSRVMLFMYLSFGFCSLFVVFCFLFLFSNLSFFH